MSYQGHSTERVAASQVMIHELLLAWGLEGLKTHVKKMQTEYKKRATIVQEAASKRPFP